MCDPTNPYENTSISEKQAGSKSRVKLRIASRLPSVCLICGGPEDLRKTLKFSPLRTEIGNLFIRRRWLDDGFAISAPLCREHRNFRRGWPTVPQILVFLSVILLPVVVFALSHDPLTALVVWLGLCIIDLCIVLWMVKQALRVRAAKVTGRDFVLVGAASEFVQACEAQHSDETKHVGDYLDNLE